jgi:phytoene synthase
MLPTLHSAKSGCNGGATRSPVADAVRAMRPRLPMPVGDFIAPVLEARAAELYAEPFATRAAFDAYVMSPELAAMRLRAALFGLHPVTDRAIEEEAARALGLVRAAARMPYLFAKGRTPLSADQFVEGATIEVGDLRSAMARLVDEAASAWAALRPRLRRISRDLRRVIVPVALAGPYLRAIQSVDRDTVRDVAEPSPLERILRLWLAARLGRF